MGAVGRLENGQFSLEHDDSLFEFLDYGGELFCGEALPDVLGAVRIPGLDVEHEHPLGAGLVAGIEQAIQKSGIVFDHLGASPDLDATPVRGGGEDGEGS